MASGLLALSKGPTPGGLRSETLTMKKLILIPSILFLMYCHGQNRPPREKSTVWIDAVTGFRKEIPAYADSTVVYSYIFRKKDEKRLGLDKLESGFDSLQIRIWHGHGLLIPTYLHVIKRSGGKWEAFQYQIGDPDGSPTVTVTPLTPKSGWDNFIEKLSDLKITTLPNMTDIPGLIDNWADGTYCDIEMATTKTYRFYYYHQASGFSAQFWQAKNIVDILKLITQELH
jgi:hypothetical protein